MTVETLERGDGETYARTGERVDVFYVGMLPSGAVFDSTESDRLRRSAAVGTSSLEAEAEGETARTFDLRWHKALTFNIGLGHVIRGLEEGVAQMSLGERARLRIPAESAYGEVITISGGDSCPDLGLPSPSPAPLTPGGKAQGSKGLTEGAVAGHSRLPGDPQHVACEPECNLG